MRPAEFTPEQIFEAGQELQAVGRNITGFALRQRIGGGNPSRLKQIWDEYVSSQSVTKSEPVAELPVEVAEELVAVTKALTDRLAALAVQLNDKAVKAAERRVAEVIRTAGEQREQAQRELVDASQTVEDLESKLGESVSSVAVLEARLADTQTRYQAQGIELARVRERLAMIEQTAKAATEQHAVECARLNACIEDFESKLDKAGDAVEGLEKCLADSQAIHQVQAVELAQVRERLAMIEQTAKAATEQHAVECARLNAGIESERQRYQQQVDQMRADLDTVRRIDALVEQNSSLMSLLKVSEPSSDGVQVKSVRGPRKSNDA